MWCELTTGSGKAAACIPEEWADAMDGIALQTNVLALNALAVDARCDDRPQPLVAATIELFRLSRRCARIAKDIEALITTSLDGTPPRRTMPVEAGGATAEIVSIAGRIASLLSCITLDAGDRGSNSPSLHRNAVLVEHSVSAANALSAHVSQLAGDIQPGWR